jgi:enolase
MRAGRHAEQGQLGANAHPRRLAGVAKAAAAESGLPLYRYVGGVNAKTLPVPMMNIINGGAHADNSDRLPGVHDRPGRRADLREACAWGAEVFHALKKVLKAPA